MVGRGRVGVEGFSNSAGMTPPTNDQRVRDDRVVVRAKPQWTASQAGSLRRYRRTSKPEQCAASRPNTYPWVRIGPVLCSETVGAVLSNQRGSVSCAKEGVASVDATP